MSEENKAAVRRFLETMDRGDWDELRNLMTPDHQLHFPLAPEPMDRDGHTETNKHFRYRHELRDQVAEGDKVVTRGVVHLTLVKEFQGIQPPKEVSVPFINAVRIADGKNAEEWLSLDTLGFMQQLGVVSPPAQSEG